MLGARFDDSQFLSHESSPASLILFFTART
jgi:hypothetical protein